MCVLVTLTLADFSRIIWTQAAWHEAKRDFSVTAELFVTLAAGKKVVP